MQGQDDKDLMFHGAHGVCTCIYWYKVCSIAFFSFESSLIYVQSATKFFLDMCFTSTGQTNAIISEEGTEGQLLHAWMSPRIAEWEGWANCCAQETLLATELSDGLVWIYHSDGTWRFACILMYETMNWKSSVFWSKPKLLLIGVISYTT
jgi:hypothetical protein